MRKAAAVGLIAVIGIVAVGGAFLALKPTTPVETAYSIAKSAAQGSTELANIVASVLPGRRSAATSEGGPTTGVSTYSPPAAEPTPVIAQLQRPATPPPVPAQTMAAPTTAAPTVVAQTMAAPVPAASLPVASVTATSSCPGNPNALGISRVVEVDTTGGPGFGSEQFKTHDFLRPGEVVLTFDDGPWPRNTPAVLAALAAHCTKAIFFSIGLHATYEPGLLKQVYEAGHAVGSHTWCHEDLSKTKGKCNENGKLEAVQYDPKDEIERGISAVHWAVGAPAAPYFRFPDLRQPPEMVEYLGKRNIAIFSADIDSFDFKMRKPEQVRKSVMAKLAKAGKGIVLMHDFQHATAEAMPDLLNDLKAGGYHIVFMKPKNAITTVASYDQFILNRMKTAGGGGQRPTEDVIRTISE
jgi:peptidoglycan/xylan/chitin deacetylase (PgdA/CDA1 family)